jgi:PAS domain S-box-containing protein
VRKKTILKTLVQWHIIFFVMPGILLSTSPLFSQNHMKFERIPQEQGFHQNIVLCVSQDHQDHMGFLWIGTSDGLNRYDGCTFKRYSHDPDDPGTLAGNVIHFIYEDSSHTLWVGTDGGLSKFDRETDSFTNYRYDKDNPDSLGDNEVLAIHEDSDGVLWVGTYDGGLNKMVNGKAFIRYRNAPGDPSSLSDNRVRAICEDSSHRLWIASENGLNQFDKETETFTRYLHSPRNPNSLSSDYVYTLCGDKSGNLWIGTKEGLDKLEPEEMKISRSPVRTRVQYLFIDENGTLWVGTYSEGLKRFDTGKGTVTSYRHNPRDFYSISHDYVESIYQDNVGILWIGTRGGGLNKLKLQRRFELYQYDPDNPHGLNHNMILSIHEDSREELWVGTHRCGLNRFNKTRDHVTHYKNDAENAHSLADNTIRTVYEDRKGRLWIGTDKGLDTFDRRGNRFIHYRPDPGDPNNPGNKIMARICEDHAGRLWIGTEKGLYEFDPGKEAFTGYACDPDNPTGAKSLPNDLVMAVCEGTAGDNPLLWIGTYNGGLSSCDPQKKKFTHYRHNPGNPHSLSNNNVRVIHIDKSGTLWVGTDGGLNKFNRKEKQFVYYKEKYGLKQHWLPNNSIYGILEDDNGNLWLSTLKGISKFNPGTGEFRNFDVRDGLQGNEFGQGTYYKSRKGEMFFGGSNGFNCFYPENIRDNLHIPAVVITDFRLANKPVLIGAEGESPLQKSITTGGEILLSHHQNFLSFEFAALDFLIPGKNRYAYRMKNFEKEWNYVDAEKRFVTYTNLDPGKYVFQVQGSNSDGTWNEKGVSVEIIITPPFWKRWWFRGLLLLLLGSLLYAGYLSRTRWLRRKLAEQQRVQELLRQSRDEMQRSRDLAEFRNAENEKLIAAISSIFIAVDARGNISQWNQPAEQLFRITAAEVKEKSFAGLLKNVISIDELNKILRMGLHQDTHPNTMEIHVQPKNDDEPKLLLGNISPIMDKSGRKFGFLLLAEDITHRKKEEMQRFLSQKLEALGQMTAGIAHEIRSPLQYIGDNGRFLLEAFESMINYCTEVKHLVKKAETSGEKVNLEKIKQIMDENDFDFYAAEIPKAADQIVSGVTRMSHIVKCMYTFAHTGDEVEETSDLNELLKTTLVVADNRLKKAADVETDYAPRLPPIHCGMGELSQVFLNLLINAADAIAETGKRGVIKVSTKQNSKELIVAISDNGIGIPPRIKDKIFNPFFTTKEVDRGTGQGLHFSYRIVVERHKGKLYFKSKVNKGTTFYIHLPIDME